MQISLSPPITLSQLLLAKRHPSGDFPSGFGQCLPLSPTSSCDGWMTSTCADCDHLKAAFLQIFGSFFIPSTLIFRNSIFLINSSMGLRLAAGICALVGIVCTFSGLISGPLLFQEMNRIRTELTEEMSVFKVKSDEIWDIILEVNRAQRMRRAAYGDEVPISKEAERAKTKGETEGIIQQSPATKCNCAAKKCPAGPKGPRGPPGERGENGTPGQDGQPGSAANDVQAQVQQMDKCFHCPMGPAGPAGLPGRPGPRGMRGGKGQPGVPGRDGQPGFPGGLGPQGKIGPIGTVGEQGIPGEDAKIIHGRPGNKGPPGIVGDQGDQGPPGPQGGVGPQGPEGEKGEPGKDGKNGENGEAGQHGDEGEPGEDAEYCPCPSRNSPMLAAVNKKAPEAEISRKEQRPKQQQPYRRRFHKQ